MRKTSTEYYREWAAKNPEKARAIKKKYQDKNKDKINEKKRAYRKLNREKLAAAEREWKIANPDLVSMQRVRGRLRAMGGSLKFHHAITADDYAEIAELQNGVCLICGELRPTNRVKRLVVDHDHASGLLRGLLCHRCNCGLGYFGDRQDLAMRAVHYLRAFESLAHISEWSEKVDCAIWLIKQLVTEEGVK